MATTTATGTARSSGGPRSGEDDEYVSPTLDIDAEFEDGPLGIGLSAKGGRVYVKSVAPGGQADRQGIAVGDVIAAVEGEMASQFTPKQVVTCLKKAERPLELTLSLIHI